MATRNGTTTYPGDPIPDSLKGPYYETYMNEDPWAWKDPRTAALEQEEARRLVAEREARRQRQERIKALPAEDET